MAGGGDDTQADAAVELDHLAVGELADAPGGEASLEEGAPVLGDGDLGVEYLAGPLEVAGVVGVVVGDGGDGDLGLLGGGEVAAEHPAVAVEGLARVDGEDLVAADEVDVRRLGTHGALIGNLDGAGRWGRPAWFASGADGGGPGYRLQGGHTPPAGVEPAARRLEDACSVR